MQQKHSGWALLAVLMSIASFAVTSNSLPPLATTIAEDIGTPYENFGIIFMLQFVCFAAASVVGGKVAEWYRLSNRTLVVCGLFAAGVILALGSLLPSLGWFVAWIIPLGLAGGLIETFASIMVVQLGRAESSKMLNFSQIFFCLGAVVAPYGVGVFLRHDIRWNTALIVFGVVILLVYAFFAAVTARASRSERQSGAMEEKPKAAAAATPLAGDGLFHLMAFSLFVYVAVEGSIVCWVAPFFEKHLGLPVGMAAWRMSFFWISIAAGRSLILVLPHRWTIWPALITGAAGMTVGTLVLSFPLPPAIATWVVVLCGLSAGPVWPVIVAKAQHVRRSPGFTSGVIAGGALGAAAGPWLVSYVIRYIGWPWFFPILTAGSLLLLMVILRARHKASAEQDFLSQEQP